MNGNAIIFDAYGTLIRVEPSIGAVYSEVCGAYGFAVTDDQFDAVYPEAWNDTMSLVPAGASRYDHFGTSDREFWLHLMEGIFSRVGIDPAPPDLFDHLYCEFQLPHHWHVYPDVRPALERLAADGWEMGILSNWDTRLEALLEALGLEEYFSVVVASACEHIEKPDPHIYQLVIDRFETAPRRIIMVGDGYKEDYAGAQDAGLTPVFLDREARFTDDARPAGHPGGKPFWSVTSLLDLPEHQVLMPS